jgi:hypothetical protein
VGVIELLQDAAGYMHKAASSVFGHVHQQMGIRWIDAREITSWGQQLWTRVVLGRDTLARAEASKQRSGCIPGVVSVFLHNQLTIANPLCMRNTK